MERITRLWRHPLSRLGAAAMLLILLLGMGGVVTLQNSPQAVAASSCQLNSAHGNIQHVIYIQFDNTHFTRDNPNVPSDLEQMPHLLNFIENNGVMLTQQHTPLIAHTATDILTSITGVYGDRHGVPVSNSFRYFNPNGSSNVGVSFAYWTDPIYDPTTSTPTDTRYNMLNQQGNNAPAPWVPYTRSGCNFGAVATANIELENIATDIPTVFGANSPQAQEVKSNPKQATADFVGIAVHCTKGSAMCSAANTGELDKLPDEPGGYNGYMALYGHKYVAPLISPNGPMKDLNGNVISDGAGHIGFPGFDGTEATVSLSYVAAMQEHSVPVTYAYISDAHDNHVAGKPFGPGEAGYAAQLKAYDDAFGKFFNRLSHDGINKSNTLFVFTADENDHFVGGAPSPANCDGVTVPCTYKQVGEIDGNLNGLLATQKGITTPFKVHADSAPVYYVTGHPAANASPTRTLERAVSTLTAVNPYTGKTDTLTKYLADPVEMNLLHMITTDPARTPTFTMFGDPNYYLYSDGTTCTTQSPCISFDTTDAWNHGDVSPDINKTWLGMVGPGIRHLGVDNNVWSDHTDTRPTMLVLLGLKDDYEHEGRALVEVLENWAIPNSLRENQRALLELARVFKQINAPVGELGLTSLRVSTRALSSNTADDKLYNKLEKELTQVTNRRNAIAAKMLHLLEEAEFGGQPVNVGQAHALVQQGEQLLHYVNTL